MDQIKELHKEVEKQSLVSSGDERLDNLYTTTSLIREAPSKVGLSLLGFEILVFIFLFILLVFVLLHFFAIPKFNYVFEKRLGDHYTDQLSKTYENKLGVPEPFSDLLKPVVTDMDQDNSRVYLATKGHGIQVYNKSNALWKTNDAHSTSGELPNSVKEVHYQKTSDKNNLWALGFDGSISKGDIGWDGIEFENIFASGCWRYITLEEITATLFIDDNYFIVGTSGKGAGIYDIKSHKWQDFSEIKNHFIKKIIYNENLIWFLTNRGVFVYIKNSDVKRTLSITFLNNYHLEESIINDIKVFNRKNAIAITIDRGCFIFDDKKWTQKILGGRGVPNLTQENIKYAFKWQNRIIVIGEKIGVVTYNFETRNWVIIESGPLPTLNGLDYNENNIVVATIDGAYVIGPTGEIGNWCRHEMKDFHLSKVSIFNEGYLYLVSTDTNDQETAGWKKFKSKKKNILVENIATPINNQPEIVDVVVHKNKFWIATKENGVILYSLDTRNIKQLNQTTDNYELKWIKKIDVWGEYIILASEYKVFRWEESTENWKMIHKDIYDYRIDPIKKKMWLINTKGEIYLASEKNSKNRWFSGKGPKELDLMGQWGVLDKKYDIIYFPDIPSKKMYKYQINKSIWEEPFDIVGNHTFNQFVPYDNEIVTLDQRGQVYSNEKIIFSQNHPRSSLDALLSVTQNNNNSVDIYGKKMKMKYTPKLGKWENHNYPFLKSNEYISSLISTEEKWGNGLAKTSLNRLISIQDNWEKALEINAHIIGDKFDGETFWNISENRLNSQLIAKNDDKYTVTHKKYFSESAPDLSNILETWEFSSFLYFVTPRNLAEYNKKNHSWTNRSFPQGRVQKARHVKNKLQIISNNKLHILSCPTLQGDSIELPQGSIKKVDTYYNNSHIVTVGTGNSRKVFDRFNNKWEQISIHRNRFEGNLNRISSALKLNDVLWVIDSSTNGKIGRYEYGDWKSYNIPKGFHFKAFMEGPDNRLFLIGKRKETDQIELPYYYYSQNGLQKLAPLPSTIQEARVEKNQYLWLKAANDDLFIYDLKNPYKQGINLTKVFLTAKSDISAAFYFNFKNNSFTKVPMYEKDTRFRSRLLVENTESINVTRDSKDNIDKIFLKTKRGIYCFEKIKNTWKMTAEYRVTGKTRMQDALERIHMCDNRIDSGIFPIEQAHFKISVSRPGYNPILYFVQNKLSTMAFHEFPLTKYHQITNQSEIQIGTIQLSISNGQSRFNIDAANGRFELPISDNTFEVDRPFIDITASPNGEWWVLRENSLTCYSGSSFFNVKKFATFSSPVSQNAYIKIEDNNLLLHAFTQNTRRRVLSLKIEGEEVVQEDYNPEHEVYSNESTGVKIVKKYEKGELTVNGSIFTGNEKFYYDKIQDIEVASSEKFESSILFVKVASGIWKFATNNGYLSGETYIPYNQTLTNRGNIIFAKDKAEVVHLKSANRYYAISKEFNEVPEDEFIITPKMVAEETNWKWFLDPLHNSIFFKAKIGEEWERVTRQTNSDGRFKDDIVSWIIKYKNAIYAGTELGIISILKNGCQNEFLIGEKIEKLKEYNGLLIALSSSGKIFKFDENQNKLTEEKEIPNDIFNTFTDIYKDPLLTIKSKNNSIRMVTNDLQFVSWDTSKRKFKIDHIKDFAPYGDVMFTINHQNEKVVSLKLDNEKIVINNSLPKQTKIPEGKRIGYHLKDYQIRSFDSDYNGLDYKLRAIAKERQKVFKLNPKVLKDYREKKIIGEEIWESTNERRICIAENKGLSFEKDLFSRQILPQVAGKTLPRYWQNRRFSFDIIQDIEGGETKYWMKTPIGLTCLENSGSAVAFNNLYPEITSFSEMVYKSNRLNFKIYGNEKYLAEENGTLVNSENSVFTKTVFDFCLNEKQNLYHWNIYQVPDRNNRPFFYLKAENNDTDANVFYEERFFWDQILTATYDSSIKHYWIITPRRIVKNILEKGTNISSTLSTTDFLNTTYEERGYQLKDAAVKNGDLFVLLKGTMENELTKRRTSGGWENASEDDYMFWYPLVEFNIKDNSWQQKKITYSEFYSYKNNFSFIGPKDYPIFTRLEWAEAYAKFSFDYITSIHPIDDTIWAGSKGGLLNIRYISSSPEYKVQIEEVILPDLGLHVTDKGTPFYAVDKIKPTLQKQKLQLLEMDRDKNIVVQDFIPPSWKEELVEKIKPEKEILPLGNKKVLYLFEYDPINDSGYLSLKSGNDKPLKLLKCLPLKDPNNKLLIKNDSQYMFFYEDDSIIFNIPKENTAQLHGAIYIASETKVITEFKSRIKDVSGLIWGDVGNDMPAVQFPSGDVYTIEVLQDISHLKIGKNTLSWTSKSSREDDDKNQTFFFSSKTGEIKAVEEVEKEYDWVQYKVKPGDSISLYLINARIVEKKNFFNRIFGSNKTELKKWVELVAQKNNIQWGGRNEYDYTLEAYKFYMMPVKGQTVDRRILPGKDPITIGQKGYQFEKQKNIEISTNGILICEKAAVGFDKNYFYRFDFIRNRVFFQKLPSEMSPHHIWSDKTQILMAFLGDDGDREVWHYTPRLLSDSKTKIKEFNRIYTKNSNKILEADKDLGFIVDNGLSKKHITSSSEIFFGTNLSKVVKILEDIDDKGYWIATTTSGLIHSHDPF